MAAAFIHDAKVRSCEDMQWIFSSVLLRPIRRTFLPTIKAVLSPVADLIPDVLKPLLDIDQMVDEIFTDVVHGAIYQVIVPTANTHFESLHALVPDRTISGAINPLTLPRVSEAAKDADVVSAPAAIEAVPASSEAAPAVTETAAPVAAEPSAAAVVEAIVEADAGTKEVEGSNVKSEAPESTGLVEDAAQTESSVSDAAVPTQDAAVVAAAAEPTPEPVVAASALPDVASEAAVVAPPPQPVA